MVVFVSSGWCSVFFRLSHFPSEFLLCSLVCLISLITSCTYCLPSWQQTRVLCYRLPHTVCSLALHLHLHLHMHFVYISLWVLGNKVYSLSSESCVWVPFCLAHSWDSRMQPYNNGPSGLHGQQRELHSFLKETVRGKPWHPECESLFCGTGLTSEECSLATLLTVFSTTEAKHLGNLIGCPSPLKSMEIREDGLTLSIALHSLTHLLCCHLLPAGSRGAPSSKGAIINPRSDASHRLNH